MKTFSHLKNVLNSPLNTVNNKNAIHASIESLQANMFCVLSFACVLLCFLGMWILWNLVILEILRFCLFRSSKFSLLGSSKIPSSQKFEIINLTMSIPWNYVYVCVYSWKFYNFYALQRWISSLKFMVELIKRIPFCEIFTSSSSSLSIIDCLFLEVSLNSHSC